MTEPYPPAQVQSLVGLIHSLQHPLPSLRWIAGHESLDTGTVPASDRPDVEVRRKRDPGPLFPWDTVLASIGLRPFESGDTSP
jgi:N-acetylmuramoyl-L-alanine amidase